MNGYKSNRHTDEAAIYAFARCEQFIRDYAESSQVSSAELIQRVAELFYRQAGGAQLGSEESVPALWRNSTRNSTGVAEVALASSTRSGRPQVGRPRGKAHYNGTHWTQQPENKAKLLRIRRRSKTHWTQLPNNRKKMLQVIEGMRKRRSISVVVRRRQKMTAEQAHERKMQIQREYRARQKQQQEKQLAQ